jgi:hypothetical protein
MEPNAVLMSSSLAPPLFEPNLTLEPLANVTSLAVPEAM